MTRTEIDHLGLPLGVFLLLAAAVLLGILFGYRRDRALVPRWVGLLLTALRAGAVLLLLSLFLEVVLRRVGEETRPGEVLVLYDVSRSMAERDEFRPDWQKVREAAALGFLAPSLRETTAERARNAALNLERAEIPAAAWDQVRRWAEAHGISRAEVDAAEREIADRWVLLAGAITAEGAAEAAAAREALAAALESLQRRLDQALFGAGGEAVRAGVAKLEPLSRLALARAVLERGEREHDRGAFPLEELGRRFRVSMAALRAEGQETPGRASRAVPTFTPDGAWTDLGQPVLDVVARRTSEALAAVVLVTDGRHNHGRPPEEVLVSLEELSIPLFTLGTGSEEPPRDARIVEVDATGKVWGGDEIKADVAIETLSMGALSIPLRVAEDEKVLKEVTAEIAADGLTHLPVSFPAAAQGPLRRKFTVSFPPQTGEVTATNNSRDFYVNVLTEKARVLLVDGSPRWEFRYLKASLEREANVKLEAFLVTRPPERRLPEGFPRERGALFDHDVLVIGDVEALVFSRDELSAIRDYIVARGGSLVLIAGERAMPYDYLETPLEEVLPVSLPNPRPPAGEGSALARRGFRLILTQEGERSPITRLVPGREPNRELWGLLPPLDWFAPVLEAKPAATVLARLPDELAGRAAWGAEPAGQAARGEENPPAGAAGPRSPLAEAERERRGPLLATLLFGAGRVFYSGVDGTWKWRYQAGDELFARFWGQVIRWAASERLPPGDEQARVGTDALRYEAPARVAIRALVQDAAGKPLERATVDAVVRQVTSGGERRVRLASIPQSGGLYRGIAEIEARPGGTDEYRVQLDVLELPGYAGREDRAAASFLVEEPPSEEANDQSRDSALLTRMAARAGPGGRYLPIDRAADLPTLVPERSLRRKEARVLEQWVLAWPLLLLFAALVTAEWVVRKRYDLI